MHLSRIILHLLCCTAQRALDRIRIASLTHSLHRLCKQHRAKRDAHGHALPAQLVHTRHLNAAIMRAQQCQTNRQTTLAIICKTNDDDSMHALRSHLHLSRIIHFASAAQRSAARARSNSRIASHHSLTAHRLSASNIERSEMRTDTLFAVSASYELHVNSFSIFEILALGLHFVAFMHLLHSAARSNSYRIS